MIKEVLAAAPTAIQVNLKNVGANVGLPGNTGVDLIIGNAIKIVLAVAVIAVLFMLIFGAFEWIISGGDKDKVANARNRITHALIGLAILGLAFVIATVAGNIIGVDVFDIIIPTLSTP